MSIFILTSTYDDGFGDHDSFGTEVLGAFSSMQRAMDRVVEIVEHAGDDLEDEDFTPPAVVFTPTDTGATTDVDLGGEVTFEIKRVELDAAR